MRQRSDIKFYICILFSWPTQDLSIYYIYIGEGIYISLNVFPPDQKEMRLSKFAAALVADQKRNVYSEFIKESSSRINGDATVSRGGHKPACSHSRDR